MANALSTLLNWSSVLKLKLLFWTCDLILVIKMCECTLYICHFIIYYNNAVFTICYIKCTSRFHEIWQIIDKTNIEKQVQIFNNEKEKIYT